MPSAPSSVVTWTLVIAFVVLGLKHVEASWLVLLSVPCILVCGAIGTEATLRIPLLLVGGCVMAALLCCYFAVRVAISLIERVGRLFRDLFEARDLHEVRIVLSYRPKNKELTYEQYYDAAAVLDDRDGATSWRRKDEEGTYNWVLVRQLLNDLRKARSKGREALVSVLDRCLGGRNVGGVLNEVR